MIDRSVRHRRFARMLVAAMGLGSLAGLVAVGCGGKVYLDPAGGEGGGGSASTGTTGSGESLCGDPPPDHFGKLVQVCIPMDGDFCPPGSTTQSVLDAAAKDLGVCGENGTGKCCGQKALEQIVCDLPPGTSDCCYVGDLVEDGFCI
jgi:hypothetical protein